MFTRAPSARLRAIAALLILACTGCTQASLGVSPETVLSTVIASLPRSTTTGTRPEPAPSSRRRRIPESPPPSAAATRALRIADSYKGVRYVWGGNTPRQGFDCSGFTKYVFAQMGIALPRTSREQVHAGAGVAPDFRALRPGDLMLFAEPGEAISHVAIYAGDGWIVHASSSVGAVGYTDLNTGGEWFVRYFVAARRVF